MRENPGSVISDTDVSWPNHTTLVDILRYRAQQQSDQQAYTFLVDGKGEISITYAQLDQKARCIAAMLQEQVEVGSRALLLYQSGLDYIAAFFGCLYAGVIAVPVYPPSSAHSLPRVQAIAANSQAAIAMTTNSNLSTRKNWSVAFPKSLRLLVTDQLEESQTNAWWNYKPESDRLAFLQYTSGSTGDPKGTMISHGNLIHNLEMIRQRLGYTAHTVSVSWVPFFHDLGLIAGVLLPLFTGFRGILMSPTAFIRRPVCWLEAITHYRATASYAPYFAYELCVRNITQEDLVQLDLRSWEVAVTGAERVRAEVMERFAEVFSACGLRREALTPAYGLAEGTLMVSSSPVNVAPKIFYFDRDRLEQHSVVDCNGKKETSQALVGCGPIAEDQRLIVVHPETLRECSPNEVGEIWVAGPSVAQGYWQRPQETEHTFCAFTATGEGPFLRTGDLGFLFAGEVVITGRLKDMIIIRGRNHYPQDIEVAVEQCHEGLRPGCGAAFSIEVDGEERLVVVQEIVRGYEPENAIFQAIRQAIAEQYELQVYAIVLIRHGSILKTSSGKIQRWACRKAFLTDQLLVVARDVLTFNRPVSLQEREQISFSRERLLALSPQERYPCLQRYLVSEIAGNLCMDSGAVPLDQPLSVLGLDSLQTVSLQYILETCLTITFPPTLFLQECTILGLVNEILRLLAAPVSEVISVGSSSDLEEQKEYSLSSGQQALWFLQHLAPNSAKYNLARVFRVYAELDVKAIEQTIHMLVERHPMLRVLLLSRYARPVQTVASCAQFSLPIVDASQCSQEECKARILEDAFRPFDMEHEWPVRICCYSRSSREHWFLLSIHHIAVDFWSLVILLNDLHALVQSGTLQEARPSTSKAQYIDYVRWQDVMLAGVEGERHWKYWQEKLAHAPTILPLLYDHPRPKIQTDNGASYLWRLDKNLSERVVAYARSQGVTLYTLLLAAFQVLLYRCTGQSDVLVGSPMAARGSAEFAHIVGYFTNYVVLRAQVEGRSSFIEFLDQVRTTVLEAQNHQSYPFASLVEKLHPMRDPSYSPLFQVSFVLLKPQLENCDDLVSMALEMPDSHLEIGGLSIEMQPIGQEPVLFDLMLTMGMVQQCLAARLQYNTDLFEAATIARFAEHFTQLLTSIVDNPSQRVAELNLLSEHARNELLVQQNKPEQAYLLAGGIQYYFERQVEQTPEAIAFIDEFAQITYHHLNVQANRLARYLQSHGVGLECRVGICIERSIDLIIGLLAILKAGGTYVPLDPNYPQDRLAFMLRDSGVSIVLTHEHLCYRLPSGVAHTLFIGNVQEWSHEDTENLPCIASLDNAAYLLYTSGSTGTPKGVLGLHRGAVNRICWMRQAFPFEAHEVCCQKTSLNFVDAVWEIFGPLTCGIPSVIISDGQLRDPHRLVQILRRHGVTRMVVVPSLLNVLLEVHPMPGALLPDLLWWVSSGETLSTALCRRFQSAVPHGKLLNLYGSSEVAADATYYQVMSDQPGLQSKIGRPIANTQVYILDNYGQPVPIGVPGELCISGDGLARGYANCPDITAERFLPHPFSCVPGARLYHTGDLARYLPDGNLEYLGRIDHQIKIRGYRVELGEIEALLNHHPAVRESVVLMREGRAGDKRLVAYIVTSSVPDPQQTLPTQHTLIADLRSALQRQVPDYMLPSAFVCMQALPLLPNGKLDRKALPVPEQGHLEGRGTCTAPRTPIEEQLAQIWTDLLGIERVSVHDNFFLLGGHSLLVMVFLSRVRSTFQIELSVQTFFEIATIAEIAAYLESQAAESMQENEKWQIADSLKPTVSQIKKREGNQLPAPLSFAQQRMWLLDQLAPGMATYSIIGGMRFRGELHVPTLERTLEEIVLRHEALRTVFLPMEQRPVQCVQPFHTCSMLPLDLSHLDREEREEKLQRLIREEALRPFDLTTGPLFRPQLFRLDGDEHLLLLNVHHSVFDGWSSRILAQEIVHLYEAFLAGKPSPLSPLPVQYTDFAWWQREWLQEARMQDQLAFWQRQLSAPLPILDLPFDRPRPAIQTFAGDQYPVQLSAAVTQALTVLGQQERATLFMTLLAAFNVLLFRYSGQTDILIGSPSANRNRAEIEPLIGCFMNTLVLRTDLSGEPDFRKFLTRVQRVCLEAYTHQDTPFEQIVKVIHPERDSSRNPLFQVMFALQDAPQPPLQLSNVTVSIVSVSPPVAHFDLTLVVWKTPEGLQGYFEYNTALFERSTIARMVKHFLTLVEGIVAHPEKRLTDLPLLSKADLQQIEDWNTTSNLFPQATFVHKLFAAQVTHTPDAVALVLEDTHLTYQELDQRAQALAQRLHNLGIGPETRVGLLLPRSLELAYALLAILKAGAAYVPFDPALPSERLDFLLEDSQINLLLTLTQPPIELIPSSISILPLRETTFTAKHVGVQQAPYRDVTTSSLQAENLAYVIYTSGSTGRPKGVQVPHKALLNHCQATMHRYGLHSGDRVLQLAAPGFDVAAEEFFATWASGACLVLWPSQTPFSPAELTSLTERAGLTLLNLPASAWLAWVDIEPFLPDSLRLVIVGSEAVQSEAWQRWRQQRPARIRCLNAYGVTEATITSLVYEEALRSAPLSTSTVPIGQPLANIQVYLLTPQFQPVPIGVPGELYIGGAGLARGYLNRPDLTAERFLPSPFGPEPGARLYRTGDLARYRSDGTIEFLGRLDHQVKLRGFRIELGEIEALLNQHAGVRESVVLMREDRAGDKRLVAYIVTSSVPDPQQALPMQHTLMADLRSALQAQLPEYMVPSAFVFMEALPLLPNGKLDRKALSVPAQETRNTYVAPRTALEEQLAQTWAEVLGCERVGILDNFFDLGGHSLLAVQALAQMQKEIQKSISLNSFFQAPTVAEMALLIKRNDGFSIPGLVPIKTTGSRLPLFCFHPAGGELVMYQALAALLDKEQPLYGLQSRALAETLPEYSSIEFMARAYATIIRKQQPAGPYSLFGWSMGGVLSHAVAHELEQAKQKVMFVGLLDSYLSYNEVHSSPSSALFEELYLAFGGTLLQTVASLKQQEQEMLYQKLVSLPEAERYQQILDWAQESKILPTNLSAEAFRLRATLAHTHRALLYDYQAPLIDAPLIVWRAREMLAPLSPTAWEKYTRAGIQEITLAGNHFTLLQPPSIHNVAQQLEELLKSQQADHRE